ncbi:uncharacterized protein DFL_009130 [Arthrobotrys flagrans]|uniref:NFACT RNA-binding domain-containing protein n=1 Tax=Arthrobotrys flagrans TaxID=97331 RepID=A0A436ZQS4_ARTFL|nr:hypothetical protein DFL_009130 [Arthrobotrys flagrans]
MVFYFTSNVVDPPAYIYVGKDKVENEELIKHGWDEDVWFHADKLSSAHIYLRLREGDSWEDIPEDLLTDLAQLTKANSIEGNKKDNVAIIYTPWSNLRKDGSMAVGQVSFKDPKKVKRITVIQRQNPIVNRLNKTKREEYPDLYQQKEDHLREIRKRERIAQQERKKEEKKVEQERQEIKYQKDHAYDEWNDDSARAGSSNQHGQSYEDFEDDFM